MDKKYGFSYDPVSVYACAVDLISRFSCVGAIHVDLGCGYAAIARQIEKAGARYVGFDANRESVEALKSTGVEAFELDLNQIDAVIGQLKELCNDYTVITISMLDVIEHLDYDCGLLSRIKEAFSSEKKVSLILSVPNSSHIDVAVKLFGGSFDYLETGLLDKTHTVIYTEKNLSRVTRKNGWKQVASHDYHLEFSEQFFDRPSVVLNRDTGIGKDFRRLKGILDPHGDVYQFVRAYVPDDRICEGTSIARNSAEMSITLVLPETVAISDVSTLVANLSSVENKKCVELLLPERMAQIAATDADLVVHSYKESTLEAYLQTLLGTRYWSFVSSPQDVCVSAINSFIKQFDGSRGTPLVELVAADIDSAEPSQFELFASLEEAASWRTLIPTDYSRQFSDSGLSVGSDSQFDFIKRAALICGIKQVPVELSTKTAAPYASTDRLTTFLQVLGDPTMRSYVVRSDDWSEAFLSELQRFAQQIEHNSVLEADLIELRSQLEARDSQLSDLEAQHNHVLVSKSWTLTKPLRGFRRTVSRLKDITLAVLRKDRVSLRQHARAVYLRFPFLKFFWTFYQYRKMKLMRILEDKTFSSANVHSLMALSNNRFGERASFCPSEVIVDFPEIDVSVVSYNSSRWVSSFVASLLAQNYPLSKINLKVVDNGSSDNTVELFEGYFKLHAEKFAGCEVIRQPNLGFGAGHDRAIRAGHSEYCLVVNLDLEFLPDSIVKAVSAAVKDVNTAAASWEFRQIPYEHPKYYDPVTLETNWSSHACILLKRDAYVRCGGYDHAIFMYGEDVELSYRLRSFGYALKYLPSATVIHHTYEEAGEVKPLQFTGSVLGNTYIRLRYGSLSDRLMAFVLYGALFIYPAQFDGAKKRLLKNIPTLLKNIPHFLRGKGSSDAKFPFRGYDYELIRDGAFWQAEPIATSKTLPLVTVITRTYRGRGVFLKQAMQSVFNQTYPNIELIVAEDGGSTQAELVASTSRLAPSTVNVRFLSNEKIGRSGVGNAAMAAATGQYYMFLDDDDLLFADHVETLMQSLTADTTLDAAYSLAFEVTTHVSEDKSSYTEELIYTPPVFRQPWDYEVMQRHNFIPIQSIMFKKELYLRWGGFDLELDQLEDWNLWLRYGYEANFRYIEKTTSLFRTPADSNTRAERHALLHDAYNNAVQSANDKISRVVSAQ